MEYKIDLERGDLNLSELEPLYRQHYGELQSRLAEDGFAMSDYNPRLKPYIQACEGGWLLNFVGRTEAGEVVGYANFYIGQDMHNHDLIATEDVIYVLPAHRNGLGMKIIKHVLADLRSRGVRRVDVNPATDPRVAKIWKRLGFREVAVRMAYQFEEN